MAIEVEKGIPAPVWTSTSRKYPFPDMEVGDSFLCNGSNPTGVRSASWQYGKHHKKKFTVRKTAAGYRCWRLK